ncbi:MAG: ABC transporter substrate-binding protein [Syntrophomonadaceae bacterium]|nr:ABC transporter substrate-binding protein [Syntrophomonadaceae bacterium]
MKKTSALLIVFLLTAGMIFAGGQKAADGAATGGAKQLFVALSEGESPDNPWRKTQITTIQEEAAKRGVRLVITDGQNNSAKQVSDVEDLVTQKPDYLLIAPLEYEASSPALQAAKEANVPVILLDRDAAGTPGVDFVTVIRADFIWEAQESAKEIAKYFNGKEANIVQLTGTPGSSVAIDRQKGFEDELKKYPNLHLIATQVGNFNRAEAQRTMTNLLQRYGNTIDAVYGHSDEESLGAVQAIKAAGLVPGKDIQIVGIGGFLDALKGIVSGEIHASIECSPYFGATTIDTKYKLQKGENVPTFIMNPGKVYDIANAQRSIDAGEGF